MKIITDIFLPAPETPPTAVAVGTFDGIHVGHRFFLSELTDIAAENGLIPMLVTFRHSPRDIITLKPEKRLLADEDEKMAILKSLGIQVCTNVDFCDEIRHLTAREFMSLLKTNFNCHTLLLGFNNRIGCDRMNSTEYVKIGNQLGIRVIIAEEYNHNQPLSVSSSRIRSLLSEGEVAQVKNLLGRYYSISGTVVHGQHLGTKIGFPTANIDPLSVNVLIPGNGVYAVRASIDNSSSIYLGVCNIGTRPTVDNSASLSIETFLFDFSDDIYGHSLTLKFVSRIRGEKRFNSLKELKEAIESDRDTALNILSNLDS